MRLLVLTQKVDRDDAILGFFHRWLEEFSKHSEKITVICLEEGVHQLPENISVHSLGKEKRRSRMQYIARFYRYIWQYRGEYDVVFVHMNPEYVVLGGILWRIWKKKLLMWYNHPQGNVWIAIARQFSHYVLHTSPYAYVSKYRKSKLMPAGIDTDFFRRDESLQRIEHSVLSLGRISKIKNVHLMVEACRILREKDIEVRLSVYGDAGEKDGPYDRALRHDAEDLITAGDVTFYPSVRNIETPALYASHEVFVNATPTGSFDKSIIEAMACEQVVVASNRSFESVLPQEFMFLDGDAKDLAHALQYALTMAPEERSRIGSQLRQYAVERHSLGKLVKEIISLA